MRRCCAPHCRLGLILSVSAAITVMGWAFFRPQVRGGFFGNNNQVGGVLVDAAGLVRSSTLEERHQFLNRLRAEVAEPQGNFTESTDLRVISLKKLQQAIARELQTGESLPDEMMMLAGIQRIEYVLLYPEQNDILLAGPGESWVVRDDASVVGKSSGRPVMMLSDLIVALQGVEGSRHGGISVSIEPTAEGRQRLLKMLGRVQMQPGQNPQNLEPMMREAFGPQLVKFTNVPLQSHYARVLLAADYQMKRISMALDPSPVDGLPSYLELARNDNHTGNENPRWWMACNYDALSHDQERLAWRLSGQGVKTLTEQDVSDKSGQVQATGRKSKSAEKWAELMTTRFDDLAVANPIFGELRNVMDLTVVATLILHEGLDQRARCDLSLLLGQGVQVPMDTYEAPKSIAPHCSFIRGKAGWIVTASGGVEITPFDVVENQVLQPSLVETRQRAAAEGADSWWWNG